MHLPINGMFGCFNTMATVLKQSPKQTTVVIYVLARDYVTKTATEISIMYYENSIRIQAPEIIIPRVGSCPQTRRNNEIMTKQPY